jgi:hypothetical protein
MTASPSSLTSIGLAGGHQVAHALDKFTRELGCRSVSVGFGHRGVAGEVYEQEGVKRLGHWSKAIGRGTAPEEILPISYTSSDTKPASALSSSFVAPL